MSTPDEPHDNDDSYCKPSCHCRADERADHGLRERIAEAKSAFQLVKSHVAEGVTSTARPLTTHLATARERLGMNDTHEQWRPVVGFEGYLEVSDHGRIRSLDRISEVAASKNGKKAYQRRFRGRMLKPKSDDQGYQYVQLWGNGKCVNGAKVHHVVLEAFVGPRPDGMECCHGLGGPSDNRLSNLRWDTRLANHADKVAAGTSKKTHCKRGHEFTPENTRMDTGASGVAYKRCRTCTKKQQEGYYRKRKAS